LLEEVVEEGAGMIVLAATLNSAPPDRLLIPCGAAGVKLDCYVNHPNIGVVRAYHKLWERHKEEGALIYIHEDVSLHDTNWMERVCLELMDPKVAIVGLGGATGIGVSDIYKRPYRIEQLIRLDYASNQQDWAVHGGHETGERRVAVVDGFFMAIKGKFLQDVGGWDWIQSDFHAYDIAMCLEAARRGWEVRTVGVSCTHHGGSGSTSPAYAEWCKERGVTMEDEHRAPHVWLYNRYRDLLPLKVQP
jgi:GT2 family glycosyltransferase